MPVIKLERALLLYIGLTPISTFMSMQQGWLSFFRSLTANSDMDGSTCWHPLVAPAMKSPKAALHVPNDLSMMMPRKYDNRYLHILVWEVTLTARVQTVPLEVSNDALEKSIVENEEIIAWEVGPIERHSTQSSWRPAKWLWTIYYTRSSKTTRATFDQFCNILFTRYCWTCCL